ncbi:MAG: T9SS type A sorting domain-containing protein [Bacteroidia bacterium]|nr:T9SS type A sorting domain-containing protein [Bacteroidia bacterium]
MKTKNLYFLKNVILILFFILSSMHSKAQNWAWAKSGQGDGTVQSQVVAVATNQSNGDVYAIGYYHSGSIQFGSTTLPSSTLFRIFFVKYNSAGVLQWAKQIGTASNHNTAIDLKVDANGMVYILANTQEATLDLGNGYSVTNPFGPGYNNYFVVKYNSDGDAKMVINGAKDGGTNGVEGRALDIDINGNIYVAGSFGSLTYIQFGPTGTDTLIGVQYKNSFLVKYNSSGVFQKVIRVFSKEIGAENGGSRAMRVDAEGNNVYVAGNVYKDPPNYNDIFVEKIPLNSGTGWRKEYGGTKTDEAVGIALDNSGGVYVTGNFEGDALAFGSSTVYNAKSGSGLNSRYLLKLDKNGTEHYSVRLNNAENSHSTSVDADNNGNVYISGYGVDTLFLGSPMSYFDVSVIRLNSNNGTVLSTHRAGDGMLGNLDIANAMAIAPNGLIVGGAYMAANFVIGSTTLTNSGMNINSFVAKLSVQGSSEIKKINKFTQFILYPNPAYDKFTVKANDNYTGAQLVVYDISGKQVAVTEFENNKATVVCEGLPSGLYQVCLLYDSVKIPIRKFSKL